MRVDIRRRVLVIVGVLLLSIWSIYPPAEKITLGLDLKGGVHLVLRVRTDDGLRAETGAMAERLREALTERRVAFTSVAATSPTEVTVIGVQDDAALTAVSAGSDAVFDRVPQPGGYVLRMRPNAVAQLRDDTVNRALETIERRVNELGVAEPVVARYTARDQILVQLPGVTNVEGAKQVIRSTAQLRLTLVEQGPFASHDLAVQASAQASPAESEVLPGPAAGAGDGGAAFYVVRRVPVVTGSDLRDARASADEFNRPAVAFTLKPEAAGRFAAFTGQYIGRALATVLDDRVTSVATINSRIDGEGQIVGVSRDEMLAQVITLKSGALPAGMDYVEERMIGASLGQASVRAGVVASLGGLALVALFMVAYYRRAGVNALVSIAFNLLILMAFVAYLPITLTLPGIAGLILTIGMGVDSNVLIFERLKEELAAGRTARAAVKAGFARVWITLVDTHVTSLIAAAFLYQYGTSPIRGFATTLAVGLLANVFTAVFVSHTLFLLFLGRQGDGLSIGWRAPRLVKPDIDFGRWRRVALLGSAAVILAGAVTMATKGVPLGIDFAGGTMVIAEFADAGVTEDAVRAAVQPLPGDEVVQQYGPREDGRFLIRIPLLDARAADPDLDAEARRVSHALEAAALPAFTIADRELVSAVMGEDLQRRSVYATAASMAAITLYIGMRFQSAFAIGGIAATLHDLLVTVSCLALAGYDLSLNVTAALLTITGYSVNDTIVVFDRVRENLKAGRHEPLATVVNRSVNQTLSRTLITAGTTFLAALALLAFGGEPLEGFAFTMLVGVASGTYSTVFIASAIAILLSRRRAPAARPSMP